MARRRRYDRMRILDAAEERQYMREVDYEVYEKIGPPVGATTFHYHTFYEILFIAEGQFSMQVSDSVHELRKGDFVLIGRNTPHRYYPAEKKHDDSRRIVLWIEADLLKRLSGSDCDLSACFREESAVIYHFPLNYEDILNGFLTKLAMSELVDNINAEMRPVLDRGYLTLFFSYLNVLCARHDYIYVDAAIMENSLVEEIDRYIAAHIDETITVGDLADVVHLSKYYFVRRFKELTGVTAHTYLINRRLMRACELLKDGEEVMNVYSKVGFSDYSVFLRNFRKTYGVSPREYAREE
ncbi:MAG: AraC family transcriptional regulator [Lachnospiraceae bacterium]|nr:AraC family transcriptional regulator [Lachnospiraceae bacterium]